MTRHIPEPTDSVAALPQAQGLFDPALERDACGVGFIADMKGRKSHAIVADALRILENLEHRGAVAQTLSPATARACSCKSRTTS
jgi:glutamate synthase (NADPH) large chain